MTADKGTKATKNAFAIGTGRRRRRKQISPAHVKPRHRESVSFSTGMRLLTTPHCKRNAPNPRAQTASAATEADALLLMRRHVPPVRTRAERTMARGESTHASPHFIALATTATMVRMISGAKTRNMSLDSGSDKGGVTPLSLKNVSAQARMKPKPATKAGTVCRLPNSNSPPKECQQLVPLYSVFRVAQERNRGHSKLRHCSYTTPLPLRLPIGMRRPLSGVGFFLLERHARLP